MIVDSALISAMPPDKSLVNSIKKELESALLKVTSDALLAADRGLVTLLGSLDLSAAFHCVDHSIFLLRL